MGKLSVLKEFFAFLKERKKWLLLPIVLFLIFLGAIIFFSQGSVLAPFIYAIF